MRADARSHAAKQWAPRAARRGSFVEQSRPDSWRLRDYIRRHCFVWDRFSMNEARLHASHRSAVRFGSPGVRVPPCTAAAQTRASTTPRAPPPPSWAAWDLHVTPAGYLRRHSGAPRPRAETQGRPMVNRSFFFRRFSWLSYVADQGTEPSVPTLLLSLREVCGARLWREKGVGLRGAHNDSLWPLLVFGEHRISSGATNVSSDTSSRFSRAASILASFGPHF